jgi:hypothetical protein
MSSTFVTEPDSETPLACNLAALDANSRSAHIDNAAHLLNDVAQERQESREGFSFRFNADDYPRIVDFVANERLCCPFFRFTLEVSPAQGPIWLHITGPDGAKSLLQAELSLT